MRIWRSMCPIRIDKSIIPVFQVFSGPIILKVWKNKSDRSRMMNIFVIEFGKNDRFYFTNFDEGVIGVFVDNESAVQTVRTKARGMSMIPFCTSFVCNELLIGSSSTLLKFFWKCFEFFFLEFVETLTYKWIHGLVVFRIVLFPWHRRTNMHHFSSKIHANELSVKYSRTIYWSLLLGCDIYHPWLLDNFNLREIPGKNRRVTP